MWWTSSPQTSRWVRRRRWLWWGPTTRARPVGWRALPIVLLGFSKMDTLLQFSFIDSIQKNQQIRPSMLRSFHFQKITETLKMNIQYVVEMWWLIWWCARLFRIRHLPQWSWGAARSLCNTVKSQSRGGNLHLRPNNRKKKEKNEYSFVQFLFIFSFLKIKEYIPPGEGSNFCQYYCRITVNFFWGSLRPWANLKAKFQKGNLELES